MEIRTAWCLGILLISFTNVDARHKAENMLMKAGSICESCSKSSSKAAETLDDLKLADAAGMLTKEVCHSLPADLEAKMHHTRLLFKTLFHDESLCNSTNLCRNRSRLLTDSNLVTENKILLKMLKVKRCTACRRTAKELIMKLKQPKTRPKIMEALVDFCEEVERDEETCKEVIYKYGPGILSRLEKMKPSDLCHRMGMCSEEISI